MIKKIIGGILVIGVIGIVLGGGSDETSTSESSEEVQSSRCIAVNDSDLITSLYFDDGFEVQNVYAVKSNDLEKDLKKGDFVYVGIEDVGEVIPWKKTFSKSGMSSILLNQNSKGVIVKKLTLGLNITSSMFEFDE